MTQRDDSLALLPNGFVDLLPPYADREAASIQTLMQQFSSYGYQRIKPPLLEFEDSLFAPGPGEALASETFRLMDPVSHRMLGIRLDITAQVSRIVSSRLQNEPRPLRLTYANDVLRIRGSQMRTERQFTQVGCELIGGGDGVQADIESCVLAILGLKALGIADITLDMTIPGVVMSLLEGLEPAEAQTIHKAVLQRDEDKLFSLGVSQAECLGYMIRASGCADTALPVLAEIKYEPSLKSDLTHLAQVCEGVKSAMSVLNITDVSLTIDLLEQSGFEYHKTLGFTLFSAGVSGELGRGGCYDIHFGQSQQGEVARGFTLYMDTISKFATKTPAVDRVYVSCHEPWNVIQNLQTQGWIVVRGISSGEEPHGCSHVYKDGAVIKLS